MDGGGNGNQRRGRAPRELILLVLLLALAVVTLLVETPRVPEGLLAAGLAVAIGVQHGKIDGGHR